MRGTQALQQTKKQQVVLVVRRDPRTRRGVGAAGESSRFGTRAHRATRCMGRWRLDSPASPHDVGGFQGLWHRAFCVDGSRGCRPEGAALPTSSSSCCRDDSRRSPSLIVQHQECWQVPGLLEDNRCVCLRTCRQACGAICFVCVDIMHFGEIYVSWHSSLVGLQSLPEVSAWARLTVSKSRRRSRRCEMGGEGLPGCRKSATGSSSTSTTLRSCTLSTRRKRGGCMLSQLERREPSQRLTSGKK